MEQVVLFLGQLALVLAGLFACVMFATLIVSLLSWTVRKVRQMNEL